MKNEPTLEQEVEILEVVNEERQSYLIERLCLISRSARFDIV